jgi:hypothetical protein
VRIFLNYYFHACRPICKGARLTPSWLVLLVGLLLGGLIALVMVSRNKIGVR